MPGDARHIPGVTHRLEVDMYPESTTIPLAAVTRFWSNVDTSGECWIWKGTLTQSGYGRFSFKNHTFRAHRVAWELKHGPIPAGMVVCHNCPGGDTRACVNDAHLFLGTQADNNHDMVKKGRQTSGDRHFSRLHPELRPHGEKHTKAVLTTSQVLEIRRIAESHTMTMTQLAHRYKVNRATIVSIVYGRSWKHLL